MTQTKNLTPHPIHSSSLSKKMLIGAVIGLIAITPFLISSGVGRPEWGIFWKIRPLIVVPAAGAVGALIYHLMDHLRVEGGWKKILANVVSVLIFIIGLWMGIVLGLAGTLWN